MQAKKEGVVEMIRLLEKNLIRAYEFANNTVYYLRIGYNIRTSIRLARDTIGKWK